MSSIINGLIVIINVLLFCVKYTNEQFLLFPVTAPTRVQIITGIGFPVDLELESVTLGYVFKAEYWLPVNASNYLDILGDPFNPTPLPINKRKRKRRETDGIDSNGMEEKQNSSGYDNDLQQKFEKYNVEASVITYELDHKDDGENDDNDETILNHLEDENDIGNSIDEEYPTTLNDLKLKRPNNLNTARWTLFKGIETLAETRGLPGRICLLRTICEAAHIPFSYSSGILGELLHIIITPSTSFDEIVQHSDNEYMHAEELGKSGAPCNKIFSECPRSILGDFSGIYTMMGNFIQMVG